MKRPLAILVLISLLFSACGKKTVLIPTEPEAPATVEAPSDRVIGASTAENAADTTTGVSESTDRAAPASKTVSTQQAAADDASDAAQTTEQLTTLPPKTTEAPKTTETQTTNAPPKTTEPKTTERAAVPASTTQPAVQPNKSICYVRIECGTIMSNLKKLKTGKEAFVPRSGVILEDAAVALEEGDTVFTVLRRACGEHVCTDNCRYCQMGGIQIEYTFTPVFETYYIEGIHQLYEKDCGTMSGWMFSVNGRFPEEGASSILVSAGDRIVFYYTCDMGDDVGNHFEG